MIKVLLILAAIAAIAGVGWPLASSIVNGGQNEATRLVQAADWTQNKAQSLSRSYSELIPPPDPVSASSQAPTRRQQDASEDSDLSEEPTPAPSLTSSEHAVKDALELLSRVQSELEPGNAEYVNAVNLLKATWDPRYNHAVDEYRRFRQRLEHASDMSEEYIEVRQRLTSNISDSGVRERLRLVDAQERALIVEWLTQAGEILAQAEDIKRNLDDMNIRIAKLELSATFASVYEGFSEMPLALTTLNTELDRFEQETERIYQVFSPKAD